MGHQIVKQPNGLYAIWSTVVDNFILWDASPKDIITEEQVEMHERIAKSVRENIARLERGEQHDTDTMFGECVKTIEGLHGKNDEVLVALRKAGLVK